MAAPCGLGRWAARGAAALGWVMLAGCSVIRIASDQGCETFFVVGFGPINLRPPGPLPAVTHASASQWGLFATQGPGTRIGLGYMEETWVSIAPEGGEALVDTSIDALGRHRVAVTSPAREESQHAKPSTVVCLHDGLGARRLRE